MGGQNEVNDKVWRKKHSLVRDQGAQLVKGKVQG